MNSEKKIIDKLLNELYPIMRSITGEGNRETLNYIKNNCLKNAKIKKINSGSKIFDWEVPAEWNIKDAYVKNAKGKKIIDLKENNLHVVSYSKPIDKTIEHNELIKKLWLLIVRGN